MIAAIVVSGLLYLLYRGFTLDLKFSKYQRIILLFVFGAGVPLVIITGLTAMEPLVLLGYTGFWLGLLGMTFVFYIVSSAISALFAKHRQTIVFAALVLLILVTAYSIFNGTRLPTVKEITIPNAKLPERLSGFTIVQLTDLHLGGVATPGWLRHAVQRVNRLEPDLIVITGDLIEGYKTDTTWKPFIEELKHLKSTYGVLAVTGNHDVVHGGVEFFKLAREAGITVLNNQTVTVAGCIQVAGISDRLGRNYELEGPDLSKALKHINPSQPLVLLSHRPEYFQAAKGYGIDLQLSGHTHAGQIPPGDFFVRLFYKHPYGLYFEEGSYIYTSCGTCVMNVPMRLFSTNEIVKIRLVRKKI